MVLHAIDRKSSANYLVPRVFAQKGFEVSIFGHTFYVHFSKIFRVLCKFELKITNFVFIKPPVFCQHNAALKKGTMDDKFWVQKKLKKKHQNGCMFWDNSL